MDYSVSHIDSIDLRVAVRNTVRRKHWRRWLLSVVGIVIVTVRVATWPVETQQGVNFVVSTYTMPLYLKAFEFIDRSAHYQRLANTLTEGIRSDRAKVEKLFQWTVQNIQATPDGWPVVDDHILNIIIRGHGVADQRADVFTTLATYAGMPAFWVSLPKHSEPKLLLSFVFVDGRWVVADVAGAMQFRNSDGELTTLQELLTQPAQLRIYADRQTTEGVSYTKVLSEIRMPTPPSPLRAELQMPLKRLIYEVRTALSLGTNDEFD